MSFVFFGLIEAPVVAMVKASRKKISRSKFDFGEPNALARVLFELTLASLWISISIAEPGTTLQSVNSRKLFADSAFLDIPASDWKATSSSLPGVNWTVAKIPGAGTDSVRAVWAGSTRLWNWWQEIWGKATNADPVVGGSKLDLY
jgi:hypothetical protein